LILVSEAPTEPDLWMEWLSRLRGSNVELRVPARGTKRRLLETAQANAREEFARHRLKRASDHNARAKALRSLQEHLGLDSAPLRIECYDISTIQGSDTVGSMVVFEDGLPKKSEYRRFKIKTLSGQDDFAAMEEVLRRRFAAYVADRDLPAEERGKFAYPPSLVIIDGGAGQLGRAVKVLDHFGLDIPVAGLAKRLEEVYQPERTEPLLIPRGEDALYLLQSVRDEAHRFAVTYHRRLRSKRMVDSILDAVPGVGEKRKRQLLRRFGSLKRLRGATFEQISEVVPAQVASEVMAALGSTDGGREQ
jgi:excinuclease ABC subunit C